MTRRLLTATFLAALILALAGCKDEPPAPPPPPAAPGMPGAPGGELPPGHPPTDGTAAGMPGAMPGGMPAGMPGGVPTPTPGMGVPDPNALPPPPSGTIDGMLELSAAMKDKVKAGDAIYIVARNAATDSIIAVSRAEAPATFPAPFSLGGNDVMHAQTGLAGKVKVEARVDKDGDAMTKNPGDIVGQVKGLVTVPAKNVVLKLDKVL